MDGLLFLASVIGIGLVMWWVRQNDRDARDTADRGLFAMRAPPAPRKPPRR
jgi:hypothetical protein